MGQKKRQRTAEYHCSRFDQTNRITVQESIQKANFRKLVEQGIIKEEKDGKEVSRRQNP